MGWRRWFNYLFVEPAKQPKTQIDITRDTLAELSPELFTDVYRAEFSLSFVITFCSSIVEYTNILKTCSAKMESGVLVDRLAAQYNPGYVLIRTFFTTKENEAIHPDAAISDFTEAAIGFLDTFQLVSDTDGTFEYKKNLIYTQHLVTDLAILAKELNKYASRRTRDNKRPFGDKKRRA